VYARRFVALMLSLALVAGLPAGAATDKQLRAVRGVVGHRQTASSDFQRVVGQLTLPDEEFAVTQPAANALLTLPDSSEIALGPSTSVQVGAFNEAAATTPTSVTLQTGALRFAIKRPVGGKSNYRFSTLSSQIAIRGTIGLLSTNANGDTIACLSCEPGDVVVTVGTKTYPLLTGQTLFISVAGVVAASAVTAALLQSFSSAGLSTTATSSTAFAPGIASSAGANVGAAAVAAGHAASAGLIVGGAAAAAVGAVTISNNNKSTGSTPQPTPTQGGSISVADKARGTAAPPPTVSPPTASPSPIPPKRRPNQ